MWLLVAGHVNGQVDYYGPFPNVTRATRYATSSEDIAMLRWHCVPLIIPYLVVEEIKWKTVEQRRSDFLEGG